MNNEDRIWEQENIDQMYADQMQAQMDYEAQMAEQQMYESQVYEQQVYESQVYEEQMNADMQRESVPYTYEGKRDPEENAAVDMGDGAAQNVTVGESRESEISSEPVKSVETPASSNADEDAEQAELFMKVFPGVEMTKELAGLFTEVYVTKITIYDKKSVLQIDIRSRHIISRPNIEKAEECVKKYLQSSRRYTVNIKEHYTLSTQYNLDAIVKAYEDSILYDIRSFSNVGYRLIAKSVGDWYCDGDAITIAIEDSKIARIHADKIKSYMEDMFQDRFDLSVNVAFEYSEADKEKLRKASALVEQQKIEAILSNLRDHGDIIVDGKAVDKDKLGVSEKGSKPDDGKKSEDTKTQPVSSGGDSGQKSGGEKEKFGRRRRYSDDPDVFIGRDVEGQLLEISSINDGIGEVVIHGQIMNTEERELRNGKIILTGYITDFTDTIGFKMFCSPEDMEVYREEIQKGQFYRMKGLAEFDSYAKEVMICRVLGMKHIQDFRVPRMDTYPEKRVELHMHTKMSEMDSVVDIETIVKRASDWGHPAIAITDHGVVQAFPIANHTKGLRKDFKIIYGVEGYFVDDLKDLVKNSRNQNIDSEYVVFDIETTGLSKKHNKIIEIGAVKVKDGEVIDTFSEFINPGVPIPYQIEQLTSMTTW